MADTVLSDEEFEEIQRRHFGKKKDSAAKVRAEKSLQSCREAVSAFNGISGVSPVALATPDDCERFQHEALKLPKNWRRQYANSKDDVDRIKPNTVIKWSRTLRAAFERASTSGGSKCVRGVVDVKKLLDSNPWMQFTWIDGTEPEKRRFDNDELISLLDYFEEKWPVVTAAPLFAKVSLWIWARKSEVASLCWEDLRVVGGQYHFDFVGKWGVRKWARIPSRLYNELLDTKTGSPFVFAAYNEQLRRFYTEKRERSNARKVGSEFSPRAFANWFHKRLTKWSDGTPNGHASQHVFRKTSLQHARKGEDLNTRVAKDASLTASVMMGNYVDEADEELWNRSNRTFARIVASLAPNVAERYGCDGEDGNTEATAELLAAVQRQDWATVQKLSAWLADQPG